MKFVALFLSALASLHAATDPRLLGLMMPDATSIAGFQVEQSRNSPLGQFLLLQLVPAAPFDELKAATGFDPRTDLTEIVASAAIPSQALLAGRGNFQPARILSMAQAAGATVSTYRGMTLIHTDPSGTAGAVFLDAATVVIGTTPAIQGAIDRSFGASVYAGPLATKVAEAGATAHAWAIATGVSEMLPATNDTMKTILAAITQISGGVTFTEAGIQASSQFETRSAQDAQSMADVLRLLATMSPQPALTGAATITNSGASVNINVALTEQQIEDLLKQRLPSSPLALLQ